MQFFGDFYNAGSILGGPGPSNKMQKIKKNVFGGMFGRRSKIRYNFGGDSVTIFGDLGQIFERFWKLVERVWQKF